MDQTEIDSSLYVKSLAKPWIDENGDEFPLSKLQIISHSWTEIVWNDYLHSIGKPQKEILLTNFDRVLLSYDAKNSTSEFYGESEREGEDRLYVDSEIIRKRLFDLTYKQRQVIELCFFEGKSIAEISRTLKLTYRGVTANLQRALERLRELLEPTLTKEAKAVDQKNKSGRKSHE